MSSLEMALANVDEFEANPWPTVAWQLDRHQTLERLRTLLRQPGLLHQRALNACGPAVFFRIWLARDPVAAAAFSCALLRDGSAAIGSLVVSASWKLLGQDYATLRSVTNAAHANATPETADWMLLSALRDSENIWFDYAGEPYTTRDTVAGITLPSSLAGWLGATNLYATVQNETNLVFSGDRQRLLSLMPTSNVDVVPFINASLLYDLAPSHPVAPPPSAGGFSVPDHYVIMTAPFSHWTDPAWMNIEAWTWGETKKGWQGTERFFNNYFGVILATV